MELLNLYVKRLLDSWTALRLGLNHESGGPNTHRKVTVLYENLPELISKVKCEDEISDFLEDYLDEELNIICEDNSHEEVGHLIYQALQLYRNKSFAELQTKINALTTGCDLQQCEGQVIPAEEIDSLSGTEPDSESENDIDMD
ncbi:unnamed protein product [Heterobilharzia americana]|nr:unnamed protein product [Heterobilharzia americana]